MNRDYSVAKTPSDLSHLTENTTSTKLKNEGEKSVIKTPRIVGNFICSNKEIKGNHDIQKERVV